MINKTLRARKSLTYRTRRLLPGDTFEAHERDARILVFMKKAEVVEARPRVELKAPPPDLLGKIKVAAELPAPVVTEIVEPAEPVSIVTIHNTAPESVDVIIQPKPPHPFDHDGDGKKGGSPKIASSPELTELRKEYEAKFGKRPFAGWGPAVLRAKISGAA